MYMQNRNTLTGTENKLVITNVERKGGRTNWGYEMNRPKLLCIKQISNKDKHIL